MLDMRKQNRVSSYRRNHSLPIMVWKTLACFRYLLGRLHFEMKKVALSILISRASWNMSWETRSIIEGLIKGFATYAVRQEHSILWTIIVGK